VNDTDQQLIDDAYNRIHSSPTPGGTPEGSPLGSPVNVDQQLIDHAYDQMSAGRTPAPAATTPLPAPSTSPMTTPPGMPSPEPSLTPFTDQAAADANKAFAAPPPPFADDVSKFSRRMEDVSDPRSLSSAKAWQPDTEDFPGVWATNPLYHPPRAIGGETMIPPAWPLTGPAHKASNAEAAGVNLVNSFMSGASSAEGLVDFIPAVFATKTAGSVLIPRRENPYYMPDLINKIYEAGKTPAGSQERYEVGLAVATTLLSAGIMGKAAFNTIMRSASTVRHGVPYPPSLTAQPLETVPGRGLTQEEPQPGMVTQPGEKGFTISPMDTGETTGPVVEQGAEKPVPIVENKGTQYAQDPVSGSWVAVTPDGELGDVIDPVDNKALSEILDFKLKKQKEASNAVITSNAQMEAGPATLGGAKGAGGQEPVTGGGDNVVGETQRGSQPGSVPRAQPQPSVAPVAPAAPAETGPLNELTNQELQDALNVATKGVKAGEAGAVRKVFDIQNEQIRRQSKGTSKVSPQVLSERAAQNVKPITQEDNARIEKLLEDTDNLKNRLGDFIGKDDTTAAMRNEKLDVMENLWSKWSAIHKILRKSGQPRDFVIIGGGGAGLKAGMQAAYEGVDTVILSPDIGGPARESGELINVGARDVGISGQDFFLPWERTNRNRGVEFRAGKVAKNGLVPRPDGGVDVVTSTGEVIPARRVLIATGSSLVEHPEIPGLSEYGDSARLAARTRHGKIGMVYGAGNSATQAVVTALRTGGAKKIYVVSRHPFFSETRSGREIGSEASDDQVRRLKALAKQGKVEFITDEIAGIKEKPEGGDTVTLKHSGKTIPVAHVEAFLNSRLNTDWTPPEIEKVPLTDRRGNRVEAAPIRVNDISLKTSMPGVYVAGNARESMPGEDRPNRIDSAAGDATNIASRVNHEIQHFKDNGVLPDWNQPETLTEPVDQHLKEVKGFGGKAAALPVASETGAPEILPEPDYHAQNFPARPGAEGPPPKPVNISRDAISKHIRGVLHAGAEASVEQQQQGERGAPRIPLAVPVEAAAKQKVAANTNYPDMVLTDLANGERNFLDPVDSTVLLDQRADKQAQLDLNGKRALDRSLSRGEQAEAGANYNAIDNQIRQMDLVTMDGELLYRDAERAWHDFRQKDYSLSSMQTKLQIAKGGEPLSTAEVATLQQQTERLSNAMAQVDAMKTRIGFRIGQPMIASHRQALRDLQYEAKLAKDALDDQILKARFQQRSAFYRYTSTAGNIVDLSRALMTSSDLSAVKRQGGLMLHGHPIRSIQAIPDMLRAARSDKDYFDLMQDIRERPNAHYYVTSKLGITDIKTPKFSDMEEMYGSQWADKIPIVGHSQRAYVYFLNRLRADAFDNMARNLPNNGIPTPDQAYGISNFINTWTGRGRVPQQLIGSMHFLNNLFFAPRYTLSRFESLMGDPFWAARNAPGVRSMIAKEYARTLTGYGVVYGLMYWGMRNMHNAGIEPDPRSSDWMKVRIGDTRWDMLAGMGQTAVLMARLGATALEPTGLVKGGYKTPGGEIKSLRNPKYGQKGVSDVIQEWGRSKIAPMPSMIWNGLAGERVGGQPTTWTKELLSLMVPITFGDMYTAITTFGTPGGEALALAAMLGDNIQQYATKPSGIKTRKPHRKGVGRQRSP
jgi:thioredoxin reductase